MRVTQAAGLSDEDFIAAFEQGTLDNFPHRSHVRMAWIYVRMLGLDMALERVCAGIKVFAARQRRSNLYHDTLTRAWVYIVAEVARDLPPEAGVHAVAHPRPD